MRPRSWASRSPDSGSWRSFLLEPKLFHAVHRPGPQPLVEPGRAGGFRGFEAQEPQGIKRTLFLSSAVDEDIVANTANLAATLEKSGAGWSHVLLRAETGPDAYDDFPGTGAEGVRDAAR